MGKVWRALGNAWSFVTDLCLDGYKTVSFSAPIISIAFTAAKYFEVPLNGLKDISYAWGLLPLTIWFFVAWAHRRAKSNRGRAAQQLREFYIAARPFTRVDKITNDDEFNAFKERADSWLKSTYEWIGNNLGPAAASRFEYRSGRLAMSLSGVFNSQHEAIVLNITTMRQNLAKLIETDAWDD